MSLQISVLILSLVLLIVLFSLGRLKRDVELLEDLLALKILSDIGVKLEEEKENE